MAGYSKIEWTDASWNPIVGCSLASPGCTNCYAMKQAARIVRMAPIGDDPNVPQTHYFGTIKTVNLKPVWTSKVVLAPDHIITAPLRWKKPRRIFANSMGDLFHESVPDEWIDRVFAVMACSPQHTFQVLTKRAARMLKYFEGDDVETRIMDAVYNLMEDSEDWCEFVEKAGWPLPNVWLGVSAEDQQRADERVPDLLATPAAVRFVSAEPLLGPIDFTKHFFNPLEFARQLHLVTAGGESGPGARPMHPDWARAIRDQCAAADVKFFFKQWGDWKPISFDELAAEKFESEELAGRVDGFADQPMHRVGKRAAGRLLDGVEHNGMPEVRL